MLHLVTLWITRILHHWSYFIASHMFQNTTPVMLQVTLHISFLLVGSNFKIALARNLESRQKNSYHIKSVFWGRTFVFLLLRITRLKSSLPRRSRFTHWWIIFSVKKCLSVLSLETFIASSLPWKVNSIRFIQLDTYALLLVWTQVCYPQIKLSFGIYRFLTTCCLHILLL